MFWIKDLEQLEEYEINKLETYWIEISTVCISRRQMEAYMVMVVVIVVRVRVTVWQQCFFLSFSLFLIGNKEKLDTGKSELSFKPNTRWRLRNWHQVVWFGHWIPWLKSWGLFKFIPTFKILNLNKRKGFWELQIPSGTSNPSNTNTPKNICISFNNITNSILSNLH